jgi:hypothetical protein
VLDRPDGAFSGRSIPPLSPLFAFARVFPVVRPAIKIHATGCAPLARLHEHGHDEHAGPFYTNSVHTYTHYMDVVAMT